MNAVHTEVYKEYTIEIHRNDCGESPREWDNLGEMVCFHNRYDLGDRHSYTVHQANELAGKREMIVLPLYLYDHSGITMSTSPFSCPWDSGQVGYIWVPLERVKKEWNVRRVSKKLRANVLECLRAEVKNYDDYLTGNVWGYVVKDDDGNDLDSCWGFFGDYDDESYGALQQAHKYVDWHRTQDTFMGMNI
jgi:hypothetical protein